jgi:photosystem II stability/assembly factor-like uncharacterized protein
MKGGRMAIPAKTLRLCALLALCVVHAACAGAEPTVQSTPGGSATVTSMVTSLAFNPADGSLLKADAGGLFRLGADSQAWEAVETPATAGFTGLAVNPDDPAILFVSGVDVGVLKSIDGGLNWTEMNGGLPTTQAAALALHSFRRETLYVWLVGHGIFRSEDGGAHWNRVPDQGPPDADIRGLAHSNLPGSMNTGWLYAATPTGAYLSMDCF